MARSRNIKPGFFLNEVLVTLPFWVRLLFAGLWTIADREGRLEDRPGKIKIAIFPADDVNVDEGLSLLAGHGFLIRYQIEGKRFIQIVTFVQHQNPHIREAASIIPAPDEHGARTIQATLIPSSLIPSSLIPDSLVSADAGETPPRSNGQEAIERRIWTDGVELLGNGKGDRSLLGKLNKKYGKSEVAQCIAITQAENAVDPKEFLIGVLKERSTNGSSSKNSRRNGIKTIDTNGSNSKSPRSAAEDVARIGVFTERRM